MTARAIQIVRAQIIDDAIVTAMACRPSGCQTFVITRLLREERGFLLKHGETMRRLKAMVRAGRVRCIFKGPGCHSDWVVA